MMSALAYTFLVWVYRGQFPDDNDISKLTERIPNINKFNCLMPQSSAVSSELQIRALLSLCRLRSSVSEAFPPFTLDIFIPLPGKLSV